MHYKGIDSYWFYPRFKLGTNDTLANYTLLNMSHNWVTRVGSISFSASITRKRHQYLLASTKQLYNEKDYKIQQINKNHCNCKNRNRNREEIISSEDGRYLSDTESKILFKKYFSEITANSMRDIGAEFD